MFADFKHSGRNETLASDLTVGGGFDPVALPAPSERATTGGGYAIRIEAGRLRAGIESTLSFAVSRGGRPVTVQPYLGARGHLVALRARDLAYLHVHPVHGAGALPVTFATEFASARSLPAVPAVQARGPRSHRAVHGGRRALTGDRRRGPGRGCRARRRA